MSSERVTRAIAAAFILCAAASAQRTWIVDPDNRPGTDFTHLQPAFAAALPGDTIRVRANYGNVLDFNATVGKGVTILAEDGFHKFDGNLGVNGVPRQQTFVMRGFEQGDPLASRRAAVSVSSSAGTVVLDGLRRGGFLEPSSLTINVYGSQDVVLRGCAAACDTSAHALVISQSSVLMIDCEVSGSIYFPRRRGTWSGKVAASIHGSRVTAVDSTIYGGWGEICPVTCFFVRQNRHAIDMTGSTLTLIGAGSAVIGGNRPNPIHCSGFLVPQPSIVGSGTVVLHPAARLEQDPRGTFTIIRRSEPVTRSSDAVRGMDLTVEVTGEPLALAATFVSVVGPATAYPFGELRMHVSYLQLLDLAALDGAGLRSTSRRLSSVFPDGLPLAFQAAILANNQLTLTPASVTVIR